MRVVWFRLSGKYGHFLRAEANVSGVTYAHPPRMALLGILGAVMGLEKDEGATRWAGASVAVAGPPPRRFWHKANIRKDGPAPLAMRVTPANRGSEGTEPRNMRFDQEWLWRPEYTVWAALPEADHGELASRLRERRWHYTPSLGLAFLFAELELLGESEAKPLPAGVHRVATLARREQGDIDLNAASADNLGVVSARMPRACDAARVFTHAGYWYEARGLDYPLSTAHAFDCGGKAVTFL